jgi:hypothetical protein
MNKKINLTDHDVTITYCVADHWEEHGNHEYGDYADCVPNTVIADKKGGEISYDSSEANGPYLNTKSNNEGLT